MSPGGCTSGLLALPPPVLQRALLIAPGGPGKDGGALCACRRLYDIWRDGLSCPNVIAQHLSVRHSGDVYAALRHAYSNGSLRQLLLPSGADNAVTRAETLLQLAVHIRQEACAPLAPPGGVGGVPSWPAAAARTVVHVAASVAAGDDGPVVMHVLQLVPGCLERDELEALLAEVVCEGTRVAVVESLLDAGADPRAVLAADGGGSNVPVWDPETAVQAGHYGMVELLLRRRALTTSPGMPWGLYYAAVNAGHVGLLRAVLEANVGRYNVNDLRRPLSDAAAANDTDMVATCLAALPSGGAEEMRQDVLGEAIRFAVSSQSKETAELLLRAGAPRTAAVSGVTRDELVPWLEMLQREYGWDPSHEPTNSSFAAQVVEVAQGRQHRLLRALLDVPRLTVDEDTMLALALHSAVVAGKDVEAARMLLMRGASPRFVLKGLGPERMTRKRIQLGLKILREAGFEGGS